MGIKIKTEIEKEIKIGDTLTPEEAQKYIEAGGFVQCGDVYRYSENKLQFYNFNRWTKSDYKNIPDWIKIKQRTITAVENPEKQELVIPLASILFNKCQELANGIGELSNGKDIDALRKEVEYLKSQLALTKAELFTIESNRDGLADELADLKCKSDDFKSLVNPPTWKLTQILLELEKAGVREIGNILTNGKGWRVRIDCTGFQVGLAPDGKTYYLHQFSRPAILKGEPEEFLFSELSKLIAKLKELLGDK